MSELKKPGNLRPLRSGDLPRVIEIDSQFSGRARSGFFKKRLDAALRTPHAFVFIGHETDSDLNGFLLARILEGEFGAVDAVAVMDGIAVDPEKMGKGLGRELMLGLEGVLRHKGILEIQSQADWTNFSLLRFLSYWGFGLASRLVLEYNLESGASISSGDDSQSPARDRISCRSLRESDLPALVRIAAKTTGIDQAAYLSRKLAEALRDSGVRISLAAEIDDHVVAFIMANMDFGEFGITEPAAVLDTLVVSPDFARQEVGSALLSQLLANLHSLRVESLRTEVRWNQLDLLAFLNRNGFRRSQRLALSRRLA